MTSKPKTWSVPEQVMEDRIAGVTLEFQLDGNGDPRLRIWNHAGAIIGPGQCREIFFNGENGLQGDAGTFMKCSPTPSRFPG